MNTVLFVLIIKKHTEDSLNTVQNIQEKEKNIFFYSIIMQQLIEQQKRKFFE